MYQDKRSPAERVQTVVDIFEAMGTQMLINGVFNGDPHPGTYHAFVSFLLVFAFFFTSCRIVLQQSSPDLSCVFLFLHSQAISS